MILDTSGPDTIQVGRGRAFSVDPTALPSPLTIALSFFHELDQWVFLKNSSRSCAQQTSPLRTVRQHLVQHPSEQTYRVGGPVTSEQNLCRPK